MCLGAQSGHVDGLSDALASAVDGSLTTHLAAVSVDWCKPGKGGDLFAVESAEFRHCDEQRDRSKFAYANCLGE